MRHIISQWARRPLGKHGFQEGQPAASSAEDSNTCLRGLQGLGASLTWHRLSRGF